MKYLSQRRLLALLLAVSLLCGSCGSRAEATTMSLTKAQGTVDVADGDGKSIAPEEGMKLYSGYAMGTQAVSYAWIGLDDTKLAKMDENSDIDIQKEGKKLAIQVNSGSLFFHVTQPLAEDETMEIATSSMLVGIRGTCGWVNALEEVCILEGTVSVTAAGQTVSVTAGEMARLISDGDGTPVLTVQPFSLSWIPEFVRAELEQDETLAAEILDASGLDVLNPDQSGAARAAYEQVLAEYQTLPVITYYDGSWEQIDWSAYRYINDQLLFFDPNNAGYAYYDVTGDGVEELFIGSYFTWATGSSYYWNALYSFDGTDAFTLLMQADEGGYDFLADGTVYSFGNGGAVDGVYRFGPDGRTLEEIYDSDIPVYDYNATDWQASFEAAMIENQDFSAHGGPLDELLEWTALDQTVVGWVTL